MAKLSDRQRSNIQVKYKTGIYTNIQLAKSYKTSESNIRKICDGITKENAQLVEAQVYLENVKQCDKSANEIAAINQAVEYRLKEQFSDDKKRVKVYDITDKILDKVSDMLKGGKKQIVMKVKEYSKENGSSESLDAVNIDLDTSDLKNMQDTIDKASVTNNTNQRHATTNITNTNTQVSVDINQELSDEQIRKEISKRGLPLQLMTSIS